MTALCECGCGGELPASTYKGRPRRFLYPHGNRKPFWSYVAKTDGCWIWQGVVSTTGYGRIKMSGTSKTAHRVAYELTVGPIPPGLELDHLCRVRLCVNPAHLEPVTPQINVLRTISPPSLNARKSECIAGHPLSGDNLRIDHRGARQCRTCIRRRRIASYYAAKSATALSAQSERAEVER